MRLLRFLIAGAGATGTNLGVLYLLVSQAQMHYLTAASIAFLVAFSVSFLMQKYWTFSDWRPQIMGRQAVLFFLVVLANTFINAGGLFVLVERFHLWYLTGQVVMSALIACESYVLYRLIFSMHSEVPDVSEKEPVLPPNHL